MNEEEVAEILTVLAKEGGEGGSRLGLRLHIKKRPYLSLLLTCVSTVER